MDDALARTLTEKIDSLPDEYISLKQQARKYLRNNSNVDKNETVNIFHRPWEAPFNWGLCYTKVHLLHGLKNSPIEQAK